MNICEKSSLSHHYLVLSDFTPQPFAMQMLPQLHEALFLPCTLCYETDAPVLYYDCTSYTPLSSYLAQHVLSEQLLRLWLLRVCDALSRLDAYILEESCLLLDPQSVYLDEAQNSLCFCVLPFSHLPFSEAVRILLSALLPRTDTASFDALRFSFSLYQFSLKSAPTAADLTALVSPLRRPAARSGFLCAEQALPAALPSSDSLHIPNAPAAGIPARTSSAASSLTGIHVSEDSAFKAPEPPHTRTSSLASAAPAALSSQSVPLVSDPFSCTEPIEKPPLFSFLRKQPFPGADSADDAEGTAVQPFLRPARLPAFLLPALVKSLIALLLMSAALLALFLLRGQRAASRFLPIYLVLCASMTLFFFISGFLEQRDEETQAEHSEFERRDPPPASGAFRPAAAFSSQGASADMPELPSGTVYFTPADRKLPLIAPSYFPFLIGSASGVNDLVLQAESIAPMHLKIEKTAAKSSGLLLTDLGSDSGCMINRQRLQSGIPTPIQPGAELMIGNLRYTCSVS